MLRHLIFRIFFFSYFLFLYSIFSCVCGISLFFLAWKWQVDNLLKRRRKITINIVVSVVSAQDISFGRKMLHFNNLEHMLSRSMEIIAHTTTKNMQISNIIDPLLTSKFNFLNLKDVIKRFPHLPRNFPG